MLAAVNGAAQVSVPWSGTISGKLVGGPHNWNGCNQLDGSCYSHKPWNSLDLVPQDGHVFAARGGYVHTHDCGPGLIRIDHGDGYQTTYLHLNTNTIQVSDGQYVFRGQWIGDIGTSTPCPHSSAQGSHVHFSLWYVWPLGTPFSFSDGQAVDWSARQLGAWVLDDGSAPQQQYFGCITPVTGGTTQCPPANGTGTVFMNDWPSEQVPVAQRPQGGTEDLFLRGTYIHGHHAPTDVNGIPYFWEDLGGLLKGSPTAVWNSTTTQLDAFGIGVVDDRVFHAVWKPAPIGWGPWMPVATSGSLGFSGPSETESVNVERESSGQMDLFIRGGNGDAQHALLDAGGNLFYWESLGGVVKGAPSGRWNMAGTRLDVYAIDANDRPQHIYWQYPSGWQPWSGALPGIAATAGTEMIMTVRRSNDQMDLFLRGIDNTGEHALTDTAGAILSWESMGGTVKGAPDGKWNAGGTQLDVFAVQVPDAPSKVTWHSNGWGSWQALGGTWG